ncbi:hypothetical protein BD779DRAFT_1609167 [Infundibulicybe gibba]|nr:hypothetical protein BD779DRAFT_1609167 [Infundibulicybe gibba]
MINNTIAFVLFAVASYSIWLFLRYTAPKPNTFELTGVPLPQPLPDFEIDKAKPRPYRPFRWEYHQNMSLKKMEPDWWIELESTYRERVAQRKRLYAERGREILDAQPGSEAACKELTGMVIEFLCARYPKQFQFDPQNGSFHNRILDTMCNTRIVDPLVFLLHHVPEDFLITQKDQQTGLYFLRAGVSCSAVGWNLATKIGKPLHEIHAPVPDYKEKMQFSMDRYFDKMPCDKPIQRGSWGLEIGQPLFLQSDDSHFKLRETQNPNLQPEDIFLRVDWQTLRRLPKSQAIVFNFKALFTPVLFAKILRDAKKPLLDYKASAHVEHIILPILDRWSREQEEKGWVPTDWAERTLNEDPFFPGWESGI